MLSVSDQFLSAVRNGGRRKTVADLYYGSAVVPIMTNIPIASGTVSVDRKSDIRRSGSLTLAADDLDLSAFQPNGIEITIRSGFSYVSGGEELVPLGVFRVDKMNWSEGSSKTIHMQFYDRGKAHSDVEVMIPKSWSNQSVQNLIEFYNNYTFAGHGYIPDLIINPIYNTTIHHTGGTHGGANHMVIVKNLAEAQGGEQFFNVLGQHCYDFPPDISSTTTEEDAVWIVSVGDTGVLVEADRTITRDDTYNAVIMYGATIDNTEGTRVFAEAFDADPASPSYFSGPFGRKSRKYENNSLTTKSACQIAANSLLKNHLGLAKTVNFTSLWNPALDVGDIILFVFLDGSKELHIVDSLNFDLASGEMTGNTRSRQYLV